MCLSPDGKYLAIGEVRTYTPTFQYSIPIPRVCIPFQYGHQPSVQVWSVAGSPSHVSELKAHKYGVQCMVSYLMNYS